MFSKDDGSEVISCDRCEDWQHLGCHLNADAAAGRPRVDYAKANFFCSKCRADPSRGPPSRGLPPARAPAFASTSAAPLARSNGHAPKAKQPSKPKPEKLAPAPQPPAKEMRRPRGKAPVRLLSLSLFVSVTDCSPPPLGCSSPSSTRSILPGRRQWSAAPPSRDELVRDPRSRPTPTRLPCAPRPHHGEPGAGEPAPGRVPETLWYSPRHPHPVPRHRRPSTPCRRRSSASTGRESFVFDRPHRRCQSRPECQSRRPRPASSYAGRRTITDRRNGHSRGAGRGQASRRGSSGGQAARRGSGRGQAARRGSSRTSGTQRPAVGPCRRRGEGGREACCSGGGAGDGFEGVAGWGALRLLLFRFRLSFLEEQGENKNPRVVHCSIIRARSSCTPVSSRGVRSQS